MTWAFIPSRPSHQASDTGDIRNARSRKKLRQHLTPDGAKYVRIGTTTVRVHYLVLPAFTGQPVAGDLYRPIHLNDDKSDNRLVNLAWAGPAKT
jgi:hypothetical protein